MYDVDCRQALDSNEKVKYTERKPDHSVHADMFIIPPRSLLDSIFFIHSFSGSCFMGFTHILYLRKFYFSFFLLDFSCSWFCNFFSWEVRHFWSKKMTIVLYYIATRLRHHKHLKKIRIKVLRDIFQLKTIWCWVAICHEAANEALTHETIDWILRFSVFN